MRHGPLNVGIPCCIRLRKGMAAFLNAYKELSRRIRVLDAEDGVPDHLEEINWPLDQPDEAQETTDGARAREKIDLLVLKIVDREPLIPYVI